MRTTFRVFTFISFLGIVISCSDENENYNSDCKLIQIELKKPNNDRVFKKSFEYDQDGNMCNISGYTLKPGFGSEAFFYEYDSNYNLIKITGAFYSPNFIDENNSKVYEYNLNNEIIARYDYNYYGNAATQGYDMQIDTFYFSHEQNMIKGIKYSKSGHGLQPEWDYVKYPNYDTTYFLITEINDLEFMFKVYDADSILVVDKIIRNVIDNNKNPFYNSNIAFNKLIYLFEQTSVNKYDMIKMPNFGKTNLVYPSMLNDDISSENAYEYKYNAFGYPANLELNGYTYKYIYECY
jgi:hypothetical protein